MRAPFVYHTERPPRLYKYQPFDWWVDSILVKLGRKEGKRQKGEETVLLVALRSNPEKPKAVRIVQAVEARAATPTPMYHTARSSRTRRAIPHRTTAGIAPR